MRMSEAQKLIRGVLATHVASTRRIQHPKRKEYLLNVAACDSESCDWVAADASTDHDEHLAAEIDKALGGLTSERDRHHRCVCRHTWMDHDDEGRGRCGANSGDRHTPCACTEYRLQPRVRWVSGWSVAR